MPKALLCRPEEWFADTLRQIEWNMESTRICDDSSLILWENNCPHRLGYSVKWDIVACHIPWDHPKPLLPLHSTNIVTDVIYSLINFLEADLLSVCEPHKTEPQLLERFIQLSLLFLTSLQSILHSDVIANPSPKLFLVFLFSLKIFTGSGILWRSSS